MSIAQYSKNISQDTTDDRHVEAQESFDYL